MHFLNGPEYVYLIQFRSPELGVSTVIGIHTHTLAHMHFIKSMDHKNRGS